MSTDDSTYQAAPPAAPDSASARLVERSIGFAVVGRLIAMLMQGCASIILGRVLQVSDFGLVNFSGLITGFVSRFNDMGVESAVLQRPALDPRTLSTAFSVKLALSGTMMLLLWVLAGPLASMLGSPKAVPVIRVLSVTFLISALSFVPSVHLRKSLRYDAIARVWIISSLTGATCSIALALSGAGFWSLALGQVVSSLTGCVAALWLQPSSYSLVIDWQECRRLLAFGGRIAFGSLVVFVCFNLDNFLIGIHLGAAALGLYGLAFNWATQICTLISGTVLSVLFPAFASLGGDREKVRDLYQSSLRQLGVFGAVAYGSFVLVSPEFLVLILGRGTDKWLPALPALQVLCVYGIMRQLLEPLANVLLALGRADLLWRSTAIVFVVELAGVGAALRFGGGIVTVAWVVLGAYSLQYVYFASHVPQEIDLSAWTLLRLMSPAIITVALLTLATSHGAGEPSWASFGVKLVLGPVCALALYAVVGGAADLRMLGRQIRSRLA